MNCRFQKTTIFDWDSVAQQYDPDEETFQYADSSGCALRQGHIALRNGDYTLAIEHYEHYFGITTDDATSEIFQYTQLRLASAYALNNQDVQALSLLEELNATVPATAFIDNMISSAFDAYEEIHSPVALCVALYQSVMEYDYWSDSESQILQFGQINDYSIPINYGGGDFSANTTGCNVTELLFQQLAEIGLAQNPSELLTQMGWEIIDNYHADINGDGVEDWVIWLTPLNDQQRALFTVSSNESYETSIMFFALLENQENLQTYPIPYENSHFLVRIKSTEDETCPQSVQAQTMSFFRWVQDGNRLRAVGSYTICGDDTLDNIFIDSETFIAWTVPIGSNCGSIFRVPVEFMWDETSLQFVQDLTPTCESEEALSNESGLFTCGMIGEDFCGFYLEGEAGLEVIDNVLNQPSNFSDENFLLAAHYWRGLVLETLNRPDEALAEYVFIYETAPDSVWADFSALHINEVN